MTTRYTTFGTQAGCCGHVHGTLEKAKDCLSYRAKQFQKQGLEFDRGIRSISDRSEIKSFDLEVGPGVEVDMTSNEVPVAVQSDSSFAPAKNKFSVSKRFEMLSKITRMVLDGYQRAEFVAGSGGGGKTFTIMEEIKRAGLEEVDMDAEIEDAEEGDTIELRDDQFIKVSGATSPSGLYRMLYENSNSLIVFDDCDGFLGNENAVNILKAVLDTTGDGTVSWNSPVIRRMGLPTQFQFTGKVIFISNKKIEKVPQALLSRSLILDMNMSNQDIIDRANMLSEGLMPELNATQRKELIDFVEEHQNHLRDVSLRTFVLAAPMVAAGYEDWKDMVLFSA